MSKRGENIYKRKDGRYEGRYIRGRNIDGKPFFGYIYGYAYSEVKTALTLAKAVSRRDKPMRSIGKGSLAEFLDFWLKQVIYDRVKLSTYAQYCERIHNHIIPALGNISVHEITTEQVQRFIGTLSKKGLASSTIRNITGLLSTAMQKACNLYLISHNPCIGVNMPTVEITERRALDREEQIRLENLAVLAGRDMEIGVFLALYAGLRIGELCALRWRDIDLSSNTLTVRSTLQRIRNFEDKKTTLIEGKPKSKRSLRRIPLPEDISVKLSKYNGGISKDSFVLTCTSKPVEPRTFRARFKKLTVKAELSVPFHSLRHTYATRCLEHNFDIQTLSELLGHAAANTTMKIYAHSVMEHKRLLTNRMRILSENDKPSNKPSANIAAY